MNHCARVNFVHINLGENPLNAINSKIIDITAIATPAMANWPFDICLESARRVELSVMIGALTLFIHSLCST